jgi:hypothetical protein
VPRLKDKHLAPLTRLAGSLASLQLTGCSGITRAACPLLAQLTNLEHLGLSGEERGRITVMMLVLLALCHLRTQQVC